MKKIFIALAVAGVALVGCEKNEFASNDAKEITFRLEGKDMNFSVATRASEVTSVSSVWWEAKQGGTVVHEVSEYTVKEGGVVETGKYWPLSGSYDYMASNVSFTTGTGAINASNDKDIIAGYANNISRTDECVIKLSHIFARTGSLTLNTQPDYTIKSGSVSWKIKSSGANTGTKGTYTIGSGWGATASTSLAEQSFTNSSDLYLIPGDYIVTVTYTLERGLYSEQITSSGKVTLVQGKVNNITATAVGGNAKEVTFTVNIESWGSKDINMELKKVN